MNVSTAGATDWRIVLDLLQRLGCGGIVIDRGGRVLARNNVAASLVSDWSGTLPPEVQNIVDRLAEAACKVGWHALNRGASLIMHLVTQPPLMEAGTMLLVLIDPGQPAGVDEGVVRNLFGLTHAEAKLADRLARGERVRAIAHERGVSLGTVRSQLRNIFGKTRTKSQAGLVLLLARLTTIRPNS